ncbi:DUF421 domain-containing protein [Litoribacter ruber]|uniref:DUF421 domain-containing protein n=1 Tax=Litoribacter ruber TaxID=702568 RepID=A0AAP2CG81_9BACT|nr:MULTISPECIES: YetF domain-containing protein [Litoribacter]MBS9523014.1 DUF421 domain-containing protein [Litoribacter alkaliphilus]MBT0810822.1 DUF421 domain-containing protein [Litoribacter ruber]
MEHVEVEMWDWHRIWVGDVPTMFLVEVLIRSIIVFATLLFTLRIMGKRMGGQLSLSEMAVMVTLGALVAVPMQIYDRGLLMGFTALIIAYFFQRGFNLMGVKYTWFEELSQGKLSILVKDGKILEDAMLKSRISKNQLFALLRNEQITHLSEVKRLYLEASGTISIYKSENEEKKNHILPMKDEKIQREAKFNNL